MFTEEQAEKSVIIDVIQDCLSLSMRDGNMSVRNASSDILRRLEEEIEVADLEELTAIIAKAFLDFEEDKRVELENSGYNPRVIKKFHHDMHQLRLILRDKLSNMADENTFIEVTPELEW